MEGKCKEKQKEERKQSSEVMAKYFDLPLSLDDLDESDFFDFSYKRKKTKGRAREKETRQLSKDVFTGCLSPIQGPRSSNNINNNNHSFSSTPMKPDESSVPKQEAETREKKITQKESDAKTSDYLYSEVDLFEDWGDDWGTQKSGITLSQAFDMIEKAEAESEEHEKETLNQSIDLLTGEVVGELFEESFSKLKSVEKVKEEEDDCVIICDKPSQRSKPQSAQKLNFGVEKLEEKNSKNICWSSDDDFEFCTRGFLADLEERVRTPLREYNSREASDLSIKFGKKRGKCFKIIESDTAEDSPSPKFSRFRRKKRRKSSEAVMTNGDFIDLEAEVSDEVGVSSDEKEEDGEYEKSFLDEDSYLSQNCSADMTAKYLESVKGLNRGGRFKIPAPKPYSPSNIFSQIPEESNTDYEIDSFCVNDVEEEPKTELSDLEIAEKILEMDRKKRKKKSRRV